MPHARPFRRAGWRALAWVLAIAGLCFRLQDLGRYSFWNDEAWVALCTRVQGIEQFWLAVSITPILWAISLKVLSLGVAAPEFSFRLLPLLFSCLTMWVAYGLGKRLTGHEGGGILALAVVAFDPLSIGYAKLLKHYSAEAFFGLWAFACAHRFARRRSRGDLVRLSLTLTIGLGFANAQLFVAGPILAALLASALLRRDWSIATAVVLAAGAVAVWDVMYFKLVMAPHLVPGLGQYWAGAYVSGSAGEAVSSVVRSVVDLLGWAWGARGMAAALVCLLAFFLFVAEHRALIVGVFLLVGELACASYLRVVPLGMPRLMLFLLTLLSLHGAVALAWVTGRLWSGRLWPVAVVGIGLLLADFGVHHRWALQGDVPRREVHRPEDLGALVAFLEEGRGANDGVLLYDRSAYVYAYYQRSTPVLVRDSSRTVGYRPRIDSPRVVLVSGANAQAAAARAFAGRGQVWLVGSRFRAGDERKIRQELAAYGTPVLEMRRARALLMLVRR